MVLRRAVACDLGVVDRMKRQALTPGSLIEAIGVRGAIAGGLALAVAIGLATCRPDESTPPDTVGVVPEQTTTTLLEFIPDTDPPDPTAEPTVPPQSLFGGDPCRALTAQDFTVVIAGLGRGQLVDASPLSDDECGYVVIVVGQEYNISVQAIDPTAFGRPPAEDEVRTALTDIGLAAYIVPVDADFTVWVKVANGYFVVTAPDEELALHLAEAAAGRADDPAESPPITTPITNLAGTTTPVATTAAP
ncbi:MAG: hypothetical protein K8R99_15585 [Actinomycetia bacterium]|nr:hypothetical protein [Actinomycetes bacterium]